jgi:hypothetical protein
MAETFKNAKLKVQSTAGDVYTVPSATTAIVIGCQVTNVTTSGTPTDTEVWWTDASDSNAVTRLLREFPVPPKGSMSAATGRLVLEAGDKIRASCDTNNNVEISVSVLEIS